jgi:hypothetical protein
VVEVKVAVETLVLELSLLAVVLEVPLVGV